MHNRLAEQVLSERHLSVSIDELANLHVASIAGDAAAVAAVASAVTASAVTVTANATTVVVQSAPTLLSQMLSALSLSLSMFSSVPVATNNVVSTTGATDPHDIDMKIKIREEKEESIEDIDIRIRRANKKSVKFASSLIDNIFYKEVERTAETTLKRDDLSRYMRKFDLLSSSNTRKNPFREAGDVANNLKEIISR